MTQMIHLKLEDLLRHLKKTHEAELQKENKQIAIMLKIDQQEVPLFVGVLHDTLVQMIAYLPFEIKADSIAEVARFLHLLNKQLDLPGFGMDEQASLLFYRAVIPCLKPEVDAELFDAYLRTLQNAVHTVLEGIKQAGDGKSPIAQAAKISKVADRIHHKKV
jgi:hypothetical protein